MEQLDPVTMKRRAMLPQYFALALWVIGLIVLLIGVVMQLFGLGPVSGSDDTSSRTLLTLLIAGVGIMLGGIFLSMMSVIRILGMMPVRLGMVLQH